MVQSSLLVCSKQVFDWSYFYETNKVGLAPLLETLSYMSYVIGQVIVERHVFMFIRISTMTSGVYQRIQSVYLKPELH